MEDSKMNCITCVKQLLASKISATNYSFLELCSAVENLMKLTSDLMKNGDFLNLNSNCTISMVLNFNQVISCLEFLSEVIKEESQVNLVLDECRKVGCNRLIFCLDTIEKTLLSKNDETSNEFGQFLKWMDCALDHIAQIDIEEGTFLSMLKSTKNIFEQILAHALSIAQICLDEDSKIINGSCRTVLNVLNDLGNELLKNEPNKAMISLFVKDSSNKLCILERRVDIAVLKLTLFVFARYSKVLEKLHNFCEVHYKRHFDQQALDIIITDFDLHVDRMFQIGLFAIFCSSNIKSGSNIKNCMASLEFLENELVPAMKIILQNSSEVQRISAVLLKNYWMAQANKLKISVYEIIDPSAFCKVIYDEISIEIQRFVEDCDKNKELGKAVFDNIFNIGKVLVEFLLTVVRVEAIKDEKIKERIRKCNTITLEIGAGLDALDEDNTVSNKRLLKRCKILQSQVEKLLTSLRNDEVRMNDESTDLDPASDEKDQIENLLFGQIMSKGKEILQNRSIMYRTPKKGYQTYKDCNDDNRNSTRFSMKKLSVSKLNFSFRSSDGSSSKQTCLEDIFANLSKLTIPDSEE